MHFLTCDNPQGLPLLSNERSSGTALHGVRSMVHSGLGTSLDLATDRILVFVAFVVLQIEYGILKVDHANMRARVSTRASDVLKELQARSVAALPASHKCVYCSFHCRCPTHDTGLLLALPVHRVRVRITAAFVLSVRGV